MAEEEQSFQQRMGRIETLIQQISQFEDASAQAVANEIVQSLLDLHGVGLTQILQHILESPSSGQALIDELSQHDLTSNLLLLYDLHPLDTETRIQQALDRVRPYLQSHEGDVEFRGISHEGEILIRLTGACENCHSSARTLKLALEETLLAAAPDTLAVKAEGVRPTIATALSLPLLNSGEESQPGGWVGVGMINKVHENRVDLEKISGVSLILTRIGETCYAYNSKCPSCEQSLEKASVDAEVLTCQACQHRFDIRHAGQSLAQSELHLEPYPLLTVEGVISVALPALTVS